MWVLTLDALPYTVADTFMDQVPSHRMDGNNKGAKVRPLLNVRNAYGYGS
jgi:hypothetical protein